MRGIAVALCALCIGAPARAQDPVSSGAVGGLAALPPRDPGELSPAARPLLSFGTDHYYVKPILVMAGGIHVERILQSINQGREDRTTTVAITRFGLEGRLGPYVAFRSEFERNIGAHGTGIWEGTASFSVRDQFLRLSRWGLILDGGIILDEASVDFFSLHTSDLLLADRYTRNPLLHSGFNRGQGVKLSYGRWGLRLGFAYTAANPLSTSTSFQIGGSFAGGSRLWERPLGNFRIGQPDDDLHIDLLSPSLTFEHRHIEVRTAAQIFWVNYQANSRTDPLLFGYNLRGSVQVKLPLPVRIPLLVAPFGNVAWIRNDVLNSTAGYADTVLMTPFTALSVSAGFDLFLLGRSGLGASYAHILEDAPSFLAPMGGAPAQEPVTRTAQGYLNAGLTCWITDLVAAGARVAMYRRDKDGQPDEVDLSVFATLRLIL